MLEHCKTYMIWVKPYTAKPFETDGQMQTIMVDEDSVNKVATSDFEFGKRKVFYLPYESILLVLKTPATAYRMLALFSAVFGNCILMYIK